MPSASRQDVVIADGKVEPGAGWPPVDPTDVDRSIADDVAVGNSASVEP
jgi:hypothetical protein